AIQQVESGTPGGIFVTAAEAGGEPSGTGGAPGSGNLNSLQNLYTHGGPHFTVVDRVGFEKTNTGEGGYKDLSPLTTKAGLGLPRDLTVG
ncbi:hypothetical protein ACSTK7_23675, partial [Vibrio parahaemolyticus]